ncbi:MAG: hypothetical protein A3K10_10985 [Bacteroidetes bacterium RIFCSPLOWO2_12_FULL_31_6]|nr:MAG: hypothetical protein A3K10_10985 [Bacteroidetes bacterium RIFCSPLOWO2_12_FULL_31_6]
MKTIFSRVFKMITFTLVMVMFVPTQLLAQDEPEVKEEETPDPKKDNKPVKSFYDAGMLIETQTNLVWPVKTLEFVIQHRFGNLNSEGFDMLGLYAPSNIRMGLNYGLFKNAQIGIASTKNGMLQEFNYKYSLLRQTKSNSMPIGAAYYGNVQYDSRSDNALFGYEYKALHRISFFNQLIIARKISPKLTLQVSAMHAHYNQIDTNVTPDLVHSNFAAGVAGRFKFSPQGSIIFEYDYSLTTPKYKDRELHQNVEVAPNISIGVEFATSAHSFHIFITTYNRISPQGNLMYSTNDFTKQDILLGFNITRNWGF